jgi:hypothetical protein
MVIIQEQDSERTMANEHVFGFESGIDSVVLLQSGTSSDILNGTTSAISTDRRSTDLSNNQLVSWKSFLTGARLTVLQHSLLFHYAPRGRPNLSCSGQSHLKHTIGICVGIHEQWQMPGSSSQSSSFHLV